jgi:type IX secretion system PorP/SprF family membrane protein
MKQRLIILLFIFSLPEGEGWGGAIFAQQVGMYSHYFYKPMLYNPAFAGYGDVTNVMLLQRNQWSDFKGAPRLTVFTMDGNLVDKKVGLGLSLISDRKGISNRTTGSLSYSYRINLNEDMHFLFGLSLSVIYQSLDFSKTLVENNSDPNLFSDLQRKTAIDASAGLAFVWKELEVSAAVPQIMQNKINYVDYSNVRGYYALARHYMASVKYKYFISSDKGISIIPQALVRFVPNAPFQYDGLITFDWKDKFWLGATYKSNYAVAANVGFSVHKQLSLGYSYDFIVSSIGNYSGMSHELMINFKFAENKKNNVVYDSTPAITTTKYEELIASLQTEIEQTDQSIKELEDRIAKQTKSNTPERNVTLTDLVVQQLLKKIEEMLDTANTTQEQIQSLRDEIAAFLDSEFSNANTQKILKKQYEQLNKSQDVTSVLVKGTVNLQKVSSENNFSAVNITVTDKETGKLVGTYIPNAKTGKFLIILTPGQNYTITAELNGYETFTEDFSPAKSNESYEITHEIRLIEKVKDK